MKTIKLLLVLTWCFCTGLQAQAQAIKHHAYITYFNAKLHCPDSVSWDLTPAMICKLVTRVDKFARDPLNPNSPKPSQFIQLPAYKTNKSIELAQGHLFSYEDAMCNPIDNVECFYVDQMYEQYQGMNAGDWKTVEVYERTLPLTVGKLHIIAGFIPTPTTLANGTVVPPIAQVLPSGLPVVSYMYKAIYAGGKWTCWIMPNLPGTKGHPAIGKGSWQVSTTALDKATGLKL
jgi:DNA/RNA endonuclease G (NUC1)